MILTNVPHCWAGIRLVYIAPSTEAVHQLHPNDARRLATELNRLADIATALEPAPKENP